MKTITKNDIIWAVINVVGWSAIALFVGMIVELLAGNEDFGLPELIGLYLVIPFIVAPIDGVRKKFSKKGGFLVSAYKSFLITLACWTLLRILMVFLKS